jgi:hypothetical protein
MKPGIVEPGKLSQTLGLSRNGPHVGLQGQTCHLLQFLMKKTRRHVLWILRFQPQWWQKNRLHVFLFKNLFSTYFDPKHLESTIGTLLNQ